MVDEDASSLLIDSAMRVIFRYFDKVQQQKAELDSFIDKKVLQRFRDASVDKQSIMIQAILDHEADSGAGAEDEVIEIADIKLEQK